MNEQALAQVIGPYDTFMDSISIKVAFVLAFFAAYLLARTIFNEEQTHSAKALLEGEEAERKNPSDIIIKWSRPFFTRYVVPVVQDMKLDEQRKLAKRRLISSGLIDELTPDEFLSMKVSLVILFPVVLWVAGYMYEFEVDWIWIVLSSPIGYFYPDMMVKDKTQKRQKAARRAMPFIIDLLALSTEAGLDFVGAIGKVVQKATPSPLVDELSQVLKEMKIGSSRAEALREMAQRLDMSEMSSFVSILISADEMGASIGKVLRQQSEQIRLERTTLAEREGAKAASKILGPMFILILPAIFITIGVPFALQMMKSGIGN